MAPASPPLLTRRAPLVYTVLLTSIVIFPLTLLLANLTSTPVSSLLNVATTASSDRSVHCPEPFVNAPVSDSRPLVNDDDDLDNDSDKDTDTDTDKEDNSTTTSPSSSAPAPPNIPQLQRTFESWFAHLKRQGEADGTGIRTSRVGCRELDAKAQTCTYEGMLCVNVSGAEMEHQKDRKRPYVYFVDDSKEDFAKVPADDWCWLRHWSADPRYYSSRHWPLLENTVVAQQSCLDAYYRTSASLFGDDGAKHKVRWNSRQMNVIDHDFFENDHNGHLASDTLWMLDMSLFQQSLSIAPNRPGRPPAARHPDDEDWRIWSDNFTLYLPQSRAQFERQMIRDVNKLLYGLVLRKNLTKLYPHLKPEQRMTPPTEEHRRPTRETAALFDAYPELDDPSRIRFHQNLLDDPNTDLVCTPKVASGFKTGFSTDERTCREIRTRTYELYGIQRPPVEVVGQIKFPQPPKSLLILDRHLNRRIGNARELTDGLVKRLQPLGVQVTYLQTNHFQTAEDLVRTYASYGIILSPHGSHNMAQFWMQRYSALIEIMPVGYTEYSFHMQSQPCKIWFYEVQSSSVMKDKEKYEKSCGDRAPHMFMPCTDFKSEDVWVKVENVMPTILHALERLGYDTGEIWFKDIYPLNESSAGV